MIRARVLAITCCYEDADDLDFLSIDPAFQLACGRLPDSGDDLCSWTGYLKNGMSGYAIAHAARPQLARDVPTRTSQPAHTHNGLVCDVRPSLLRAH
jgi:hypothetical protein